MLNNQPQTDFDPARLYTSGGGNIPGLVFRTLTTRNRADGAAGAKVVPDLATDTGQPSQNATVWTYHLKDGLKYQDGTPITTADIKYDIERSFAPELSGGAPYLRDWLVGAAAYQGPYKDPKGLSAIQTPDAKTIVFHLDKPEGDFPLLATQTSFAPVPKAKDTGTKYDDAPGVLRPVRGGLQPEQRRAHRAEAQPALVGRDRQPAHGVPGHHRRAVRARPGRDQPAAGRGRRQGRGRRHHRHQPRPGRTRQDHRRQEPGLPRRHRPLRLHRLPRLQPEGEAVRQHQGARGRSPTPSTAPPSSTRRAAPRSTSRPPPSCPPQAAFGYTPYDPFPAGATGDPAKAKELLKEAGYPHGLTVTLTHDTNKGGEQGPEVATAVQEALKLAGITVKLDGEEHNAYSDKVHSVSTEPGLFLAGWGADWPSGGPFLGPIFDGRQIVKDGTNFNNAQLNDPSVDNEIDAINKITDLKAAAARWGALDKTIGEQALTVPLYHPVYKRLFGKNIKNVVISDWTGVLDVSRVAVK